MTKEQMPLAGNKLKKHMDENHTYHKDPYYTPGFTYKEAHIQAHKPVKEGGDPFMITHSHSELE